MYNAEGSDEEIPIKIPHIDNADSKTLNTAVIHRTLNMVVMSNSMTRGKRKDYLSCKRRPGSPGAVWAISHCNQDMHFAELQPT